MSSTMSSSSSCCRRTVRRRRSGHRLAHAAGQEVLGLLVAVEDPVDPGVDLPAAVDLLELPTVRAHPRHYVLAFLLVVRVRVAGDGGALAVDHDHREVEEVGDAHRD